jgi:hypothetical protein
MTIETEVAALTTSTTALVTAVGLQQITVDAHITAFAAVTNKVNTELNLVDNTADADKPVSAATQLALDTKQLTLVSGVNIKRVNGVDLTGAGDVSIQRSATSLTKLQYDDRGDLRNLSPEIDDSAIIVGMGLYMWTNTKEEPDDDETCFSTATGQWVLTMATRAFSDIQNEFEKEVLLDRVEAINNLLGITPY